MICLTQYLFFLCLVYKCFVKADESVSNECLAYDGNDTREDQVAYESCTTFAED